jgi:hypothetical protein
LYVGRLRLKCDGTPEETGFRLSAKRRSTFKSVGWGGLGGGSVQLTTGRRAVHISLQGLYGSCKPVFCSHVTLTGYPLHSLVFPSLPLSCITVCHHISTGLYLLMTKHDCCQPDGVYSLKLLPPFCHIIHCFLTYWKFIGIFKTVRHQTGARCWWRSWLRHCATSQKVAGSIPDGVIGIFH